MPLQLAENSASTARSADDIREWIVREVAKSLNSLPATVDPSAPLETLGVDSLGAIGLTSGLAEWLGRDVSATLMWDYPTINAIAEGLADREASGPPPGIVEFQSHGDRTPIFFFPGVGGHPITFGPMTKHLGSDQPCYGLTVPGLNGECDPLTRVEDIVAAIIKNIRRVQPHGPYQLAGYSFGGLLAYEAALQLTAAGEKISLLAIYDTIAPEGRTVRPMWQRMLVHVYLLATRPGRIKYFRTRFKRLVNRCRTVAPEDVKNDPADARAAMTQKVGRVNGQAAMIYRPRAYSGPVLLFRAIDREKHSIFHRTDESFGWNALTGGKVQVMDLPGNHVSLLDTTRARAAADLLRPFLAAGKIAA